MNISELKQLMTERNIASEEELVGVSEFEIKNFEKRASLKLPTMYRHYLQAFGRSAGLLSTWMAIYFDDLWEIKENFAHLCQQNSLDFKLPANTLLISQMGSYFDYFYCDSSQDPSIYRIEIQGQDGAFCEKCATNFNHYLELLITNNKNEFAKIREINLDEDGDIFEEELTLVI